MRLEVNLSDQMYARAQSEADRLGVSLNRFVLDAVQSQLGADQEQTLRLSDEQMASIYRSERELDSGLGLTAAQVKDSLEARKAAWLKAQV